jgi:hypothetical protein
MKLKTYYSLIFIHENITKMRYLSRYVMVNRKDDNVMKKEEYEEN